MKRLICYGWPLVILVASWLASNRQTVFIFCVLSVLYIIVVRRRLQVIDAVPGQLHRRLGAATVVGSLFVLLGVVIGGLDITIARNFLLLIVVATVPLGLELTIIASNRHSQAIDQDVSVAAEDAATLLFILAVSFAASLLLHVPPALSALQILFATVVSRPLLAGILTTSTLPEANRRWRVLFTGLIVYGSYLFFFIRHYLDPLHVDSTNRITWQATTLAMVVFIICQAAPLLLRKQLPKSAVNRVLLIFALLLIVLYVPGLQRLFMTGGLAADDWVWAIVAGLLYLALCQLQRHTAEHGRQAVLELRRNIEKETS